MNNYNEKLSKKALNHALQYSPVDDIISNEVARQTSFKAGAEWQSKQSPWISVEEQLPQSDDDLYIVLDTKMNPPGCGVCDFNPKTKAWIDERYNIVNPTHWMPIPKIEE